MGQPQGSAEWATNDNYASPGDPWDTTPTKVNPPAGKTAEGWEPEEEVPAQFLNDWQNRAGALLEHLRLVQPANWELLRDISPTTPQRFRDIGYDPSTGIYITTGNTAASACFLSKDGGNFWAIPPGVAPIALPFGNGVESDGAGNWVIVAESPSISESSDSGDNWTTRVPGGNFDEGSDVKYDPVSALWVISGLDDLAGANGRQLFTSPDRVTWTNRITTTSAGHFLAELWVNAAGFGIVCGDGDVYYTSPDMITWTGRVTGGGVTQIFDVVYSEAAELWFMSVNMGGTYAIMTSSDGISFSVPAGQSGLPNEPWGAISCDQGELIVAGWGNSGGDVVVSVDRALTWELVAGIGGSNLLPRGPRETAGTATGFSDLKQHLNYLGGQFITVAESGNLHRTLKMF